MARDESRPEHAVVEAALPWYVNGTAEPREIERVTAHLPECPVCRAEVRRLETLRDAVVDEGRNAPPGPPFEAVLAGVDRSSRRRWRVARWALGGQAAAIVVLGGLLALPDPTPPEGGFRLLRSEATVPVATRGLRVVFDAAATEAELRELLLELRGQIVGGPSALGAWEVAIPEERFDEAIERLRGTEWIRLAEPIQAAAQT